MKRTKFRFTKLYLVFYKRPYYVRFSIDKLTVVNLFCCYKDMYLVLIIQAFFNIYFLVCLFATPSDVVYHRRLLK